MGTTIKHPVPDRVKPSFVILTSGHSDAQSWASECPDVKNYKWRHNPVWHRMLYSCTHMSTAGVKGLRVTSMECLSSHDRCFTDGRDEFFGKSDRRRLGNDLCFSRTDAEPADVSSNRRLLSAPTSQYVLISPLPCNTFVRSDHNIVRTR